MTNTEFKKLKAAFRYWVLGKAENDPSYYDVLTALRIAEKYHVNKRKDGAHEFSHQIAICSYLRTLHKYFRFPALVFVVALLHDTPEDYPESKEEILELLPTAYPYTIRMSKIDENGNKMPYEIYFGRMKECPVCSLVKLADRIANISTMIGVFDHDKQTQYLQDLEDWFFPMLKYAKRKFPDQEPAFENMKSVLFIQKDTILKMREEPKA